MVFKWLIVLSVLWGMYKSGGNEIQRDDIELTLVTSTRQLVTSTRHDNISPSTHTKCEEGNL